MFGCSLYCETFISNTKCILKSMTVAWLESKQNSKKAWHGYMNRFQVLQMKQNRVLEIITELLFNKWEYTSKQVAINYNFNFLFHFLH